MAHLAVVVVLPEMAPIDGGERGGRARVLGAAENQEEESRELEREQREKQQGTGGGLYMPQAFLAKAWPHGLGMGGSHVCPGMLQVEEDPLLAVYPWTF